VSAFSFKRFVALLRKEWLQMVRDPITLRFIIALPMMQLFLFGYAINTNPKNLGTYIACSYLLGFDEPPTGFDTLILTGAVVDHELDLERFKGKAASMLMRSPPLTNGLSL
jgi:hypothetical protein